MKQIVFKISKNAIITTTILIWFSSSIPYLWLRIHYFSYTRVMINLPLFIVPLIVAVIIQSIKIIVDFFAEGGKRIKIEYLRRAGWFPSVHSGISSSLTTLLWLTYGVESPYFAIALSFSLLFRYDAMNVRYEAGKHAQYINEIKEELKSFSFIDYKLNDLKERLGHTFVEVIGGIFVGSALTRIIYYVTPLINSLLNNA